MKLLTEFWKGNKDKEQVEVWDSPNTYVNHWETKTYFVPIPGESDDDAEESLMDKLYDLVHPILSNWVGGLELTESSLYGIRVYKAGAILAPHVDRLPLVTSCIINVDQDVVEPWPIEIYSHDGIARNITLEPGEMLLYESHTVIHGRPFPLVGNDDSFYANVFVHFEPLGHTERHARSAAWESKVEDTKLMYEEALKELENDRSGVRQNPKSLPSYIAEGSSEETMWRQSYVYSPDLRKSEPEKKPKVPTEPEGMTAHTAAATGKLQVLKSMQGRDPALLHKADSNGWTPMHEAARGGQKEVLEFLVKEGGALNDRTNAGKGGTPLWWAEQMHGANHAAVRFLRDQGAMNVAPEL